jgi:beta-N-acetylhexosaminidase
MKDATFLPGNMTLGATKKPEYAYEAGKISGKELISLGINVNLAPVLDVATNPKNPVIGVRSYSSNPDDVASFGSEYIKGLQEAGVIAVGKHFPGHGDTAVDSHYGLPKVDAGRGRLNYMELIPFKKAVGNNLKGIMSAHILFPAYEQENLPATLSEKVLTGLLRQQLGFEGLIFTDCMEMKAIADHYGTANGALLAVVAGANQVCISHTLEEQLKAVDLIEEAVKDGRISEDIINERVSRVLKAKEELSSSFENFLAGDVTKALDLLHTKSHHAFAQKVVDESFTKVTGNSFRKSGKCLLIAPDPFATTIADDTVESRSIVTSLKTEIPDIDAVRMNIKPENKEQQDLLDLAKKYDQVVICTYNANIYTEQLSFLRSFLAHVKDLYVISMRNPYDLTFVPEIRNYSCLYEYTPNAIRTLIKYLKGNLEPQGFIPVEVHPHHLTGISVYVGLEGYTLEENLKYLEEAKKHGVELVFTSALMPELNKDFQHELSAVIRKVQELSMKLIIDVSKPMMDHFMVPEGTYALRLDYGFSDADIVKLSRESECFIELNASTITRQKMESLISQGLNVNNVRLSHNFYPKKHTGLTREKVKEQNDYFRSLGLDVLMYVPSHEGRRPPLYEGLPTVEEHRTLPLSTILQECFMLGATEVCFGDAYASADEIGQAVHFSSDMMLLPLRLVKGLSEEELNIIKSIHRTRIDEPASLKRSTGYRGKVTIRPFNTVNRPRFCVTIDNDGYLRYQGELNIVMHELESDPKVNVVGYLEDCEYLVENLKSGSRFKFVIKE